MPKRKQTAESKESSPAPALRRSTRAKPPAPVSSDPVSAAETKQTSSSAIGREAEESDAKSEASEAPATKKTASEDKKKGTKTKSPAVAKPTSTPSSTAETPADGERWYWLLKAEPETRYENGTDVRFSIDDLKARTEPEPWDGTYCVH